MPAAYSKVKLPGLSTHAVERGEDVLRVRAVGTCDDGIVRD
jgi:hypothetical protein